MLLTDENVHADVVRRLAADGKKVVSVAAEGLGGKGASSSAASRPAATAQRDSSSASTCPPTRLQSPHFGWV
jgi:hypothetical protein